MGSSSENTFSDGGQSSMGSGSSRAWMRVVNNEGFKWPKIHTSYSVNALYDVFSNTTGEKADLLQSIGFGFLLKLPKPEAGTKTLVNRRFSLWLLKIMDPLNCALSIKGRGRIPISPEDVNRVLGIPFQGADITDEFCDLRDVVYTHMKGLLMLDDDESLNLKSVEKVLRRKIEGPMASNQKVAFMVASVIFASSLFLAPRGRPASISKDLLLPLMDPSNIPNLNWAKYLLRILCDSSSKVKRDIFMMTKTVTLDGCLLVLQVMYLDNIDFGADEPSQLRSPRMIDYTYITLDKLISLEKHNAADSLDDMYGRRQLKQAWKVPYSRGDKYRLSDSDDSESSNDSAEQTQLEEVIDNIVQQQKQHITNTMESVTTYLLASADNMYDRVTSVSRNLSIRQKRKRAESKASKKARESEMNQGSSSKVALGDSQDGNKNNEYSDAQQRKVFRFKLTAAGLPQGLAFRSIYTDRAATSENGCENLHQKLPTPPSRPAALSNGADALLGKLPTPSAPPAASKSTRLRFNARNIAKVLFPVAATTDDKLGEDKHDHRDNAMEAPKASVPDVHGIQGTDPLNAAPSTTKMIAKTIISTKCIRTGAGRSIKIRNVPAALGTPSSAETPDKDQPAMNKDGEDNSEV
ncbi:hypothetical protein ACP70R_015565 [Stipagrostis hirtigluma subsp. patula]